MRSTTGELVVEVSQRIGAPAGEVESGRALAELCAAR